MVHADILSSCETVDSIVVAEAVEIDGGKIGRCTEALCIIEMATIGSTGWECGEGDNGAILGERGC